MPTRTDSTWIALHDHMDEHPKIEPLGDDAWQFVRLLFYCHRQSNNGLVPKSRWVKIPKRVRDKLIAIQPGQANPLVYDNEDDGAVIHDYLDWQRSADEVATAKQKSSDGGSLGNHRRWHKDKTVKSCRYCDSGTDSVDRSGVRSVPRSVDRLGA